MLMWEWRRPALGLLAFPLVLYIVSIVVAIMAARQLKAHRGATTVEDRVHHR
ncbi:hypothetical protein ACFOW4_10320 [Micromonospora sp. GCM10011542]|uniref:hypothetical protein n=1 Tax=Micromonospora sp. GCM10011542 TaxID=3317337 RepID=UPI003610FA16